MDAESNLLISAVRRSVVGTTEDLSLKVDWEKLLKLAQMHKILPLLYDGLQKDTAWEQVPEKVQQILYRAFLQAVQWDTQMNMLAQKLRSRLEEENIPHIFLKGAVLKENYPVPALRTMCDTDILVHVEDYPRIDAVAKSLGGVRENGDGNHRTFIFPGRLAVEFHPNLIHHDSPVGTQINPGWQYACLDDPHKLTEEGFYLNTLCHLANHFAAGGVGVRFVLDVWVNRHLRKPEADRGVVETELSRFGLLAFSLNIEALAECWFGEGESKPLLENLGEYILTSGSHGQETRAILNGVSLSAGGTRASALMSRVFYSRTEMEDRFPWCKGKPWLLPAAWCVRAYRVVTRRGRQTINWSKQTGSVTDKQVAQQKKILEEFGIQRNR